MSRSGRLRVVALGQLALGALVLAGVWGLLPARFLPVDALGTLLGVGCVAAGALLLRGSAFAVRAARIAGIATLALGLLTTSALCMTIAHLSGSYGPVGQGGALLMIVIALLVLPYLVGLPLLQLAALRRED